MTKSRCAVTSILLIGSCLAGCSKPEKQAPLADFADAQRESLNYVFYRDNPPPEPPTKEELEAARNRITAADEFERQVLTELYPDDPELWALAIRDSDGDGVFDFRISDYYGRFMEGDTDLDGDGTDNVLDSDPYIPGTPGVSGPIPAHVDWAKQGKTAAMVRIQRELFVNNQVLLVERSAEFSLRLAQSVNDTIQRVYREIFADGGTLRTLRIIATERASLLNADDEQGAADYAQVLPASQTIEIYQRGINAAPAIQLGFLTHEIGHSIQFAMDYDQQRQAEITQRNYFPAHNFYDSIEVFGWTLEHYEQDPDAEFELFRPQYISQEPYEYRYLEETPENWALWLAEIYDEVGPKDYLSDQRLVERHIVGDYSLSGPWEWHSDHLIAYIYLTMLDAVEPMCSGGTWRELANRFQKETIEKEWPYFRFENARGAPIQKHLANEYPLDSGDIAYLSGAYLFADYPGCGWR
jgi:hypothetical protein